MFDDVRVVEPAQDLDLALHFFEDALRLDLALVQDLDCHLVVGHFIHGH